MFATDGWNRDSHQMTKDPYGVFEITLQAQNGRPAIENDSKIKVGFGNLKLYCNADSATS